MTQTSLLQELSYYEIILRIREMKEGVLKGKVFDQDFIDEVFELIKEKK